MLYVTSYRFFRLAAKFPELNFVAAHMGVGVLGTLDAAIDAWLEHCLNANVSFDLGTMRISIPARCILLTRSWTYKLCFGTDAPLYWPPALTWTLQTLDLSPEDVLTTNCLEECLIRFPQTEKRKSLQLPPKALPVHLRKKLDLLRSQREPFGAPPSG